jgi:DMSO/TMAO reductase YedYZ molybdopterin-dependent catalytic subunit
MKKNYCVLALIATIFGILLVAPIGSIAIADSVSNLEIVTLSGASHVFTYSQLLDMPKTIVNADLFCNGALVTYGNWGGVPVSYLLMQADANASEVGSVQFVASDGYQVTIPIKLAMDPQIIVAYELDGKSLVEGLRLIIPGANGAAWIAEIISITVSTSGADYPSSVSVSPFGAVKANNLAPTQNSTTPPSLTQLPASVQPQPSTPENSSGAQKASPTNVAQPNQLAANLPSSSESLNLQTILYVIGVICTISLSAAYLAFRHKRKQL